MTFYYKISIILFLPLLVLAQPISFEGNYSPASIGLLTRWGDCQGEPAFEMEITISPDSLELNEGPCEGYIIGYKGFDFLGKVAAPRVPYVSYPMNQLPEGMLAKGVEVIASEIYKIKGNFEIAPESHPIPTLDPEDENYKRVDPCSLDTEIYNSNSTFPGYLCSYKGGVGYKGTVGFLELLPIQVRPKSQEVYFIKEVKVRVYIRNREPAPFRRRPRGDRSIPATNATNIIICADSLTDIADSFAVFHESYGVETYVVAVESIDAYYDTVPGPDTTIFPGWQQNDKPDFIDGYNWDRARRIVAYLRDSTLHPFLETLTLLGDADVIPPSYYYYSDWYSWYGGADYNSWYAVDFLYMSYDYDIFPDIACGRLSVKTRSQAHTVLGKQRRYYNNIDVNIFKRTAFFGGNYSKEWLPAFEGQMVGRVNNLKNSGLNIISKNHTDSLHNGKEFFRTIECDTIQILSHSDHGTSFSHWRGYWSTSPYMSYGGFSGSYINNLPILQHPPLLFMGGCNVTDYDAELTGDSWTSFDEEWIRNDHGGIAIWGFTRYGLGWGESRNSSGIINLTGGSHDSQYYVLRAFNNYNNTLGEVHLEGINDQIGDVSSYSRCWPIVLMGFFDAGLYCPAVDTIPERQPPPSIILPTPSKTIPANYNSARHLYILEYEDSLPILYSASGPVRIYVSEADFLGPILWADTSYTSPYMFYPRKDQSKMYLLRFKNEDNLEKWAIFYAGRESLSVDGDKSDWDSLGFEPLAIDDSADTEDEKVELYDLYISEDDDYYYFGFHCWGSYSDDANDFGYILAIDSEPGGYSGTPGSTEDPNGCLIAFSDDKAPDYFLYFWKEYRYDLQQRPNAWFCDYLCETYGGYWGSGSPLEWRGGNLDSDEQVPDAYAHGYRDGGSYPNYRWWFESRVGKEMIGNPDSINVVLYSVYGENSHAPYVDCVPSNPDSLLITEFVTYGLMPITVKIDTPYNDYGFAFIADGVEYTDSNTFMWTTGTIHTIEFKVPGDEWLGYKTQTDGIFSPYRYLGRFLKWSDGTTDYDSSCITINVPGTPTTFTCHLKDIQAGPEVMLPHGEFFDISGEKKPVFIDR